MHKFLCLISNDASLLKSEISISALSCDYNPFRSSLCDQKDGLNFFSPRQRQPFIYNTWTPLVGDVATTVSEHDSPHNRHSVASLL